MAQQVGVHAKARGSEAAFSQRNSQSRLSKFHAPLIVFAKTEKLSKTQDTDVRMSHMSGNLDTFEINGTKQCLNLKPG